MRFKPWGKEKWETLIKANGNTMYTYDGAPHWFAEHWADAIEVAMAQGRKLEDCADQLSHEVLQSMGKYSLTGFQYGWAVGALSRCWMFGERLRQWHNLKTQIKDEGERANIEGGVLNPALMTINLEKLAEKGGESRESEG